MAEKLGSMNTLYRQLFHAAGLFSIYGLIEGGDASFFALSQCGIRAFGVLNRSVDVQNLEPGIRGNPSPKLLYSYGMHKPDLDYNV